MAAKSALKFLLRVKRLSKLAIKGAKIENMLRNK